MNQLEICQARYRSNTWMGRTRIDSPNEFEPSKFDCIYLGTKSMSTSCKVISFPRMFIVLKVMSINYSVMSVSCLFIVQYVPVNCMIIECFMGSIHQLRGQIAVVGYKSTNGHRRIIRRICIFFSLTGLLFQCD